MYPRFILTLILLLFSACSQTTSTPDPEREKIALAHRVARECGETLCRRHNMVQNGQGGRLMYEIKGLFISFQIYRSLSKKEARSILMDCAHEVIDAVNKNPEIQKYLLPGGFNKKSVQIKIFINPDHQENFYPDIGVCSYNYGELTYRTHNPEDIFRYKTEEDETYEEALTLLKQSEPLAI